jgi:uncharacterized membrane protein YidH (DUF202 family)
MPDLDLRTTLLKDKLALLSAIGSIASIFALGIVLVDKAVSATSLDPQSAAWRFIFFFIALFGVAGSALFTYLWTKAAIKKPDYNPHQRVFAATLRTALGLILMGVCMDGIFAALYWKPWLRGIARLFRMLKNY